MQFVCRTCLGSEELRPLFPVKTKYRTFQRALFLSTGLQIKMGDGLPQTICKACAMFVKSAIQFRNKSHASEGKLQQLLKDEEKNYNQRNVKSRSPSTETSGEENDNIVILNPPEKIEVEVEPKTEETSFDLESCSESDNVDPTSSKNNDIILKKEPVDIEIYIEPMKKEKNKSNDNYMNLVKTSNAPRNPRNIKQENKNKSNDNYMDLVETSNDPENPRQCKLCKKKMKTVAGIRNHVIRHSVGYRFLCELCGKSHTSRTHVLRHQRAMHGLERDDSFPCSYCDFKALDREMLEVHERRIHTKERPFVCNECGEAFYSKRVLKQHFITHTTDRPFQCELCLHTFKSKAGLTIHITQNHKVLKYMYRCPHCPKTYRKTYAGRKHVVKVHGIPKDQQGKFPRFLIDQGSTDL